MRKCFRLLPFNAPNTQFQYLKSRLHNVMVTGCFMNIYSEKYKNSLVFQVLPIEYRIHMKILEISVYFLLDFVSKVLQLLKIIIIVGLDS